MRALGCNRPLRALHHSCTFSTEFSLQQYSVSLPAATKPDTAPKLAGSGPSSTPNRSARSCPATSCELPSAAALRSVKKVLPSWLEEFRCAKYTCPDGVTASPSRLPPVPETCATRTGVLPAAPKRRISFLALSRTKTCPAASHAIATGP